MEQWTRGAPSGDACHPMRPYMAAGGALAVEDGTILKVAASRNSMIIRRHSPGTPQLSVSRVADVQQISTEKLAGCEGPTRNQLVLLLRSLRGAADAAKLIKKCNEHLIMYDVPDPMITRDLVGYGEEAPPHPAWPEGAAIAVNFNLPTSKAAGRRLSFNGDGPVRGHAE